MFSRKTILIIIFSGCLYNSSAGVFTPKKIGKNLGKLVSSYVYVGEWGAVLDQWFYTTKASKLLLAGEQGMLGSLLSSSRFFDNRFKTFTNNAIKYSQKKLQEAIKDTILLSPYSTRAYSVSTMLDYLVDVLQSRIVYVKNQIKHDSRWDQKTLHYMKNSFVRVVVLMVFSSILNKYVTHDDVGIKHKMSHLELLQAITSLGIFYTSYEVLKGCYKVLTTDPNAYNQYLEKYEELLVFVQNLKIQLEANGYITFKLANGRIATLKSEKSVFGLLKRDKLIFGE